MSFKVSTTGSDVVLADLGLIVEDPTVDRDLALEFTPDDLSESEDLAQAIEAGDLELKTGSEEYGEYIVDPTEYYPGLALQNQLIETEEENYITEAELRANALSVFIHPEATGIPLTSTADATNNVYATTAKFQKWKIAPGDKAVIIGGPAAGTYTVASGIDQQQFQTVENIPDSAAVGTLSLYHPVGVERIGIDPNLYTSVSGVSNLGDVLQGFDIQLSAGAGLPPATASGQVLYSKDGSTFTVECPILGKGGWLWTEDGQLLVI